MKLRALAVVALLATAGCQAPEPEPVRISCGSGPVTGQGSSAQTNAVNAWIKAYQIACPEATVEYASTGSGAGVRAFLTGTGDFAGTDTPLSTADQAKADARCGTGPAVHLPLVAGPIALAYNVAGVDSLRLRPDTIARILSGRITVWNDPAVAADNQGVALPATAIRVVHRSDDSGTTANVLAYLAVAAPSVWTHGTGSAWPLRGGDGRRGSHRVVAAIAGTDGAIGYVESSYARVNDLPGVRVGTSDGRWADPTDHAAGLTIAAATVSGAGGDLRLAIDHTVTGGAYPIVSVTYEVVCRGSVSGVARSFLGYAASEAGQEAAANAGFAPLPPALREQVVASVAELG
ncbi:phosphate ABC transporter substrate-binding protein PstS [Actinoplanes derwentensis]|uniref:Phosphate-binding protein n=2 Tax=Actinoplanes derwentensis TaxID=113562 RepID=A0A1H2DFA5_9ACTN|nr:phosphate ABC transporter substrate-binding protein PstS [Actinoplanes derwentensis]GID84941.1 phosphate-binding protein PstS [Actinoplanes derwentensis]SDS09894.1 phosphate transport system substrate-binding protein [Actinoplanes derwentensis]SDT81410.1 phosphate ABC transporter substrate-binding protein, PhoT family [Actinoplanes derwentensis]